MNRIKRWAIDFMWHCGWVPRPEFEEVVTASADLRVMVRSKDERIAELLRDLSKAHGTARTLSGKVSRRDQRIRELEVGGKPIPTKASDIRQHLIETDREKATGVKYAALKQRTREVVDRSVAVAEYLRRLAAMPGRGNEDASRLHSAADMLHDTQYSGSLPEPIEPLGPNP